MGRVRSEESKERERVRREREREGERRNVCARVACFVFPVMLVLFVLTNMASLEKEKSKKLETCLTFHPRHDGWHLSVEKSHTCERGTERVVFHVKQLSPLERWAK